MSGFFAGERLTAARAKVAEYPQPRSAILPLLHMVQGELGYVPRDAMREIADLIGITPAEVLGTGSFYTMFKFEKMGKHLVSVCGGISCMLMGSHDLYRRMLDHFGVGSLGTTDDGEFSFELVECAAACGGAPAVQVDYLFFENVGADDGVELLEDIRRLGLDTVYAERGSMTAPLSPGAEEALAAGPAPKTADPRAEAEATD